MNAKICAFLFLFGFFSLLSAQDSAVYCLTFSKKNLGKCTLSISPESHIRKEKYHLEIDENDYSLQTDFVDSVAHFGKILYPLRWKNALMLKTIPENIQKIQSFDFVLKIDSLKKRKPLKSAKFKWEKEYTRGDYGMAFNQLHLHHIDSFHAEGFKGAGMKIAVFDAGFKGADSTASLAQLFQNQRIFPQYNFVYQNRILYDYDTHGAEVLGCMGSYIADTIVGSAPEASFYLFITEDVRSESHIEEYNWAAAVEKADSLGVDIINSSLGYNLMDDPSESYTQKQMDGHTSIIAQAAAMATAKRILVVNSAGNDGDKPWHIISTPADVESVLAVGALDTSAQIANFSSRGYNAAGIIKPDVCAVGRGAVVSYNNGSYIASNGTSFASPLMAGMVACFWQKYRNLDPETIKFAVRKSADRFPNPNRDYGYGIPDFLRAERNLGAYDSINPLHIAVYPNPCRHFFLAHLDIVDSVQMVRTELWGLEGLLRTQKLTVLKGAYTLNEDVSMFASGLMIFKIWVENQLSVFKIVKW